MKRIIVLLYLVVVFIGFGENVSEINCEELSGELKKQCKENELERKLSDLEVRFEKFYTENVDNNPYSTGETLKWGTGLTLNMQGIAKIQESIDIGYTFLINSNKVFEEKYIGDVYKFRFGMGLGFQHFDNEFIYDKINEKIVKSKGNIAYSKFSFGSPVLLNFISVTSTYKIMYIFPLENGLNDLERRFGFGSGVDFEFWIQKNSCFTIGVTTEGDFDKDSSILEFGMRPTAGFKMFFNGK